ncbi:MAG: hypothetical protein WKG01_25275 [Kofleriaceae bacterium]
MPTLLRELVEEDPPAPKRRRKLPAIVGGIAMLSIVGGVALVKRGSSDAGGTDRDGCMPAAKAFERAWSPSIQEAYRSKHATAGMGQLAVFNEIRRQWITSFNAACAAPRTPDTRARISCLLEVRDDVIESVASRDTTSVFPLAPAVAMCDPDNELGILRGFDLRELGIPPSPQSRRANREAAKPARSRAGQSTDAHYTAAMRERFRAAIERRLARGLHTPLGVIARNRVPVRMGSPGGTHGDLKLWVYARAGTELEMVVGFFQLFTPDDVICKVVPAGDYPRANEGASVQLNADRCLAMRDDQIALGHHGRVSASGSISRARLVEMMSELCPDEMRAAGIASEASWPLELGRLEDLPALFDRLFLYAYCIEQAKRFKRDQSPLSRLV